MNSPGGGESWLGVPEGLPGARPARGRAGVFSVSKLLCARSHSGPWDAPLSLYASREKNPEPLPIKHVRRQEGCRESRAVVALGVFS